MSLISTLIVIGLAGWGWSRPILPFPYQFVYLNPSSVGYHLQSPPQPILSNRVSEDVAIDSEEDNDKSYDVTQFHTEDERGRIVYGFQSPDQVRMEARDPDGTVRGSYSYVDPYGNIVKMQYWDEGNGIHMAGNNLPIAVHQVPEYTPEVRAAREEHFRLYNAALATLRAAGLDESDPENQSDAEHSDESDKPQIEEGNDEEAPPLDDTVVIENESVEKEPVFEHPKTPFIPQGLFDNLPIDDNEDEESIVIENPELIKIDWERIGKSNQDATTSTKAAKPEMNSFSSSQDESDNFDSSAKDSTKTSDDKTLEDDLRAIKPKESEENSSSHESEESEESPDADKLTYELDEEDQSPAQKAEQARNAGGRSLTEEKAPENRAFFYQFAHLIPQPVERVDESIQKSEPSPVQEPESSSNVKAIPVISTQDSQVSPLQRLLFSNAQLIPIYVPPIKN